MCNGICSVVALPVSAITGLLVFGLIDVECFVLRSWCSYRFYIGATQKHNLVRSFAKLDCHIKP